MRYWLHPWTGRTLRLQTRRWAQTGVRQINHTAADQFLHTTKWIERRGEWVPETVSVEVGDVVWIGGQKERQLLILGALTVGAVGDETSALKALKRLHRVEETRLWDAFVHLVGRPDGCSPVLEAVVPPETARELSVRRHDALRGPNYWRPLKMDEDGRLDKQTLRGLIEMDARSSQRLAAISGWRPPA